MARSADLISASSIRATFPSEYAHTQCSLPLAALARTATRSRLALAISLHRSIAASLMVLCRPLTTASPATVAELSVLMVTSRTAVIRDPLRLVIAQRSVGCSISALPAVAALRSCVLCWIHVVVAHGTLQ